DVPVVAHRVEVLRSDGTVLDAAQRVTYGGDAEDLRHGAVRLPRDVLRQHRGRLRHRYRAACGSQLPREQAEQRGLPGAVAADERGDAVGERRGQTVEHGCAIRPGEGEVGDGHGVAGTRCGVEARVRGIVG